MDKTAKALAFWTVELVRGKLVKKKKDGIKKIHVNYSKCLKSKRGEMHSLRMSALGGQECLIILRWGPAARKAPSNVAPGDQ